MDRPRELHDREIKVRLTSEAENSLDDIARMTGTPRAVLARAAILSFLGAWSMSPLDRKPDRDGRA